MGEQEDLDAMLHSIGQVFGPTVNSIQFDDGSSFALPEWEALKEPLVSYGDTSLVGDWAWITEHRRQGGKVSRYPKPFPQQIMYISPETPPRYPGLCVMADAHSGMHASWGTRGSIACRTTLVHKKEVKQTVVFVCSRRHVLLSDETNALAANAVWRLLESSEVLYG